jgi:hypothetical protein
MRRGKGCDTEVVNSRVGTACEARAALSCESGKALAVQFPEHEAASRPSSRDASRTSAKSRPSHDAVHPDTGHFFFFRDSTASVTDSVCKSECSTTRKI